MLGVGGMGEVYRARDTGRSVAYCVVDGEVFSAAAPRVWSDMIIGRPPYGRDFSLSHDASRFVVFPSRDLDTHSTAAHVRFAINILDQLRSTTADAAR
jgi:hypothetical protein